MFQLSIDVGKNEVNEALSFLHFSFFSVVYLLCCFIVSALYTTRQHTCHLGRGFVFLFTFKAMEWNGFDALSKIGVGNGVSLHTAELLTIGTT